MVRLKEAEKPGADQGANADVRLVQTAYRVKTPAQVPQKLAQLSDSGSKAMRASAMFARAAVALQQGDTRTAIAAYKSAAADSGLPQPYRDAAKDILAPLAPRDRDADALRCFYLHTDLGR